MLPAMKRWHSAHFYEDKAGVFMAKEKNPRLEFHLKFNRRNPRHMKAALALASVDRQYKSSFIALAIDQYMQSHPMGISLEELFDMYRQSERSYQPKIPINENLKKIQEEALSENPHTLEDNTGKHSESTNAIDKAMDYYDIS